MEIALTEGPGGSFYQSMVGDGSALTIRRLQRTVESLALGPDESQDC